MGSDPTQPDEAVRQSAYLNMVFPTGGEITGLAV
jgi:hypothetical protein